MEVQPWAIRCRAASSLIFPAPTMKTSIVRVEACGVNVPEDVKTVIFGGTATPAGASNGRVIGWLIPYEYGRATHESALAVAWFTGVATVPERICRNAGPGSR